MARKGTRSIHDALYYNQFMPVLHTNQTAVVVVRLPKALNARLKGTAKRRKVSKSAVVRQMLESYLPRDNGSAKRKPTFGDLAGHLIGCVKGGPRDASTNPKYMEGFGE